MLMALVIELSPRQIVTFEKIAEELAANGLGRAHGPETSVAIQLLPARVGAPDAEKLSPKFSTASSEKNRRFDRNIAGENRGVHRLPLRDQVNMRSNNRKWNGCWTRWRKTDCPMTCPHGRPVVLRYSMKEIEKAFHRI